jgi:hypothetical protein
MQSDVTNENAGEVRYLYIPKRFRKNIQFIYKEKYLHA